MRDLGAERGRKARAERALIARGDEGARLVDRKAVPGGKADLRQFVGDDGILRQHLAQDVEVRHLRLNLLDLLMRRCRCLADRGAAAAGLLIAGLPHRCEQFAGRRPWHPRSRRHRACIVASPRDRYRCEPISGRRGETASATSSAIPAGCRSRSSDRCSATAGRPPPSSARVHAHWRRCRGRCGTPPPARRSFPQARGFPRARGWRRCRQRSSASCWPRSARRRP